MSHDQRPPLPASHAPGSERELLRKIPWILLLGTLLPAAWAGGSHLLVQIPDPADRAKYLLSIDIQAIALVVTVWMGALTATIGCGFVMVMKGRPCRADSYEIPDSDDPRPPGRREDR